MEAYIVDWLAVLFRWGHVLAGIAWIGASFYFVWLDISLNQPPRDPEDDMVAGDLWAVHGGGFYHAQKYKVAPRELPTPLHWFKWEAYLTWLTGVTLMVLVYYLGGATMLTGGEALTPALAIGSSAGLLVVAWLVYDALCRLVSKDVWVSVLGLVLFAIGAYVSTLLFSPRGSYMQIGAMLGTIMAANVFFIIIPSQKELVAAKQADREPEEWLGLAAKRRSVHNNYITLPVVFIMLSGHAPATFGHAYSWLVLIVLSLVGGSVRHFMNLHDQGRTRYSLLVAAGLITHVLAAVIAPQGLTQAPGSQTPQEANKLYNDARSVIADRCLSCHSEWPHHITAPVAPNGVKFDTHAELEQWAAGIYERTVVTKDMPLANLTEMSDEERNAIAEWYEGKTNR